MDVRLSPMLFLDVPVRHVYVPDFGVIVLVAVSGKQVRPVLATMEVVRHVKVLVTMLQGLVVMTSMLRHSSPPAGPVNCLPHGTTSVSTLGAVTEATPGAIRCGHEAFLRGTPD